MTEKLLEKQLREKVKSLGGKALKYYNPWEAGFPDRLVLMPGGRSYWVELKTTGKKPTRLQEIQQGKLITLGFQVFVVDSEATLAKFLNTIKA